MSDKFKDYNNKGFGLWHKTSKNKVHKDILSEADDIISKLILDSQYSDETPRFKIIFASFICTLILMTTIYVIVKF